MDTLAFCLDELNALGYKTQFKATHEGLLSLSTQKLFQPHEVKIIHFFRFEGMTNPSDNSIVYAIETNGHEKGTLVDGYGIATDSEVSEFMHQVQIHK